MASFDRVPAMVADWVDEAPFLTSTLPTFDATLCSAMSPGFHALFDTLPPAFTVVLCLESPAIVMSPLLLDRFCTAVA